MPPDRKCKAIDWLAVWILISSWASLSGWCLSALGQLDPLGVTISWALFLTGLLGLRENWLVERSFTFSRIVRSRFLLPRIWLALVVLAFIGGAIHLANNYDYLSYRFARVLNWSWHHGWFWIPTINGRMNYSGTGYEWLMIPSFVVFHTDRLFFLINWFSYLFLPALVFSVFSHLGISRRIAWVFMWVLPCGYCYILQAASAGNDTLATVYLLASLHYLFRTRCSHPMRNGALSCLAIGLVTGTKASNLPLVLPWLACLYFQRRHIQTGFKPAFLILVMAASVAVSFVPMGMLNVHFTGDFSGDPENKGRMKLSNPLIGAVGNSLQLAKDNLIVPLMPKSVDWSFLLPGGFKDYVVQGFPRLTLVTEEMQIEEGAGVGLGVVVFLALFAIAGTKTRCEANDAGIPRDRCGVWIVGAGAVAFAAYLAKMGSESTSRLVAAYYPLLVAGCVVLVAADGKVMRRYGLRWVGLISMLSAFPLVILSPARPLFPVGLLPDVLEKLHVPAAASARSEEVYRIYAGRADAFHDIVAAIPPQEKVVGYVQTGNSPAAAMWRPFGSRQVIETTPLDASDVIKAQGIRYVLVSEDALIQVYHLDIASVTSKWSAQIVGQYKIEILIHDGPRTWYLVRL